MTTDPALNILIAYPYMNASTMAALKETAAAGHVRFLLDCGAFTAWASGKTIALDDYCRFVETLDVPVWRYFALDVIGDPEATLKNYHLMLDRGFNPVPVLTPGESMEVMDHYYETSDVVAVGGLNGLGTKKHGYVKAVMRHAAGRKVHLLGYATDAYLKVHRPYMCDASTWESGGRFGSLSLYLGRGQVKQIKKKDFHTRPAPEIMAAIAGFGINPSNLARHAGWSGGYSDSRRLGALSWVAKSMDVERAIGTKLFLACATPHALNIMRDSFAFLTKHREPA